MFCSVPLAPWFPTGGRLERTDCCVCRRSVVTPQPFDELLQSSLVPCPCAFGSSITTGTSQVSDENLSSVHGADVKGD